MAQAGGLERQQWRPVIDEVVVAAAGRDTEIVAMSL